MLCNMYNNKPGSIVWFIIQYSIKRITKSYNVLEVFPLSIYTFLTVSAYINVLITFQATEKVLGEFRQKIILVLHLY